MAEQIRLSKWKRDKRISNIQINERDIEIIKLVHQHRLITSKQIFALIGDNPKALSRRLHLMFHNCFLDRPMIQFKKFENLPMVYALGNKGADILSQEPNSNFPITDWTSKNKIKDSFFDHTLLVSNILINFELACRNTDEVDFISQKQIIRERQIKPKLNEDPLSWKVEYEYNNRDYKYFVIPDGAFGLRIKKTGKIKWFLLEADRNTMPVKRSNLNKTSFYRKLINYNRSRANKCFGKVFSFSNPRVLTVTTSEERIKNIIKHLDDIPFKEKAYRMFIFTTKNKFQKLENTKRLFDKIWIDGRKERISIID